MRLNEIYNIRLDADLVVLSACQTALGKEIKAEGLIGLTRGFIYAGAPRVVASVWKVNDSATAELMKRFYADMLDKGMRHAAALRAHRPHCAVKSNGALLIIGPVSCCKATGIKEFGTSGCLEKTKVSCLGLQNVKIDRLLMKSGNRLPNARRT